MDVFVVARWSTRASGSGFQYSFQRYQRNRIESMLGQTLITTYYKILLHRHFDVSYVMLLSKRAFACQPRDTPAQSTDFLPNGIMVEQSCSMLSAIIDYCWELPFSEFDPFAYTLSSLQSAGLLGKVFEASFRHLPDKNFRLLWLFSASLDI